MDKIFLSILSILILLTLASFAFDQYQTKQAALQAQQAKEAAQQAKEAAEKEAEDAKAKALADAHAMRPSSDLSQEAINALDNTDQEFWFSAVAPNTHERAQVSQDIAPLMDDDSIIWLGEDNKHMYLTMDLGYEYNNNVEKILDIAKEYNVKINFFLTGEFLETEPAKVKRMYNEGHMIGNHTVHHPRMPEVLGRSTDEYESEIHDLEKSYTALTGGELAPYIRPPYGSFSERTLAMNKKMGYYTVFWSFAYKDWDTSDQLDPAIALENVTGQFHNGAVLLLHTISNTNVEILPQVFKAAQEQGYQFKRLDERFLTE